MTPVVDGRFSTRAKGEAVVKILAGDLGMKEEQIRSSYVQRSAPTASPMWRACKDLQFFIAQGEVTDAKVDLEKILELSLVDSVVKALGPDQPKKDSARTRRGR
jgi:hypothetical protein